MFVRISVAVIVAPGTAPPLSSLTLPTKAPTAAWPAASAGKRSAPMTHNPIPARRRRAAHVREENGRVIESSLSVRHQLRMNPRESLMKTPGRLRKKQKGCRTMAAALLGSGIDELRVDDLRNQRAVDVGQPHVAAVVEVRQLRVIEAEQMQHRRVQVVVRDRLLAGLVPELVARAD